MLNQSKIALVIAMNLAMIICGLIGQMTVMANANRLELGKGFKMIAQANSWPNDERSFFKIATKSASCEKQLKFLERTQNGSNQETEQRDCPFLCFYDVENDIDLELTTCSLNRGKTKRNNLGRPIQRLVGGKTAFTGALPYVVRLTFQSFDQFHSDSQACFHSSLIKHVCPINLKTILRNIIFVLEQLLMKTGF